MNIEPARNKPQNLGGGGSRPPWSRQGGGEVAPPLNPSGGGGGAKLPPALPETAHGSVRVFR